MGSVAERRGSCDRHAETVFRRDCCAIGPSIRCCGASGFAGHLPRVRCQPPPPNWWQCHGRVLSDHLVPSVAPAQNGLTPYQPLLRSVAASSRLVATWI